jgi:predicted anti-sigma-YlaC factor YlaD
MKCKNVKKMIISYTEQTLSKEDLQKFREHLKQCSECTKFFETFATVWQNLDATEHIQTSPFFYANVERKLNEQKMNTFSWLKLPLAIRERFVPVFNIAIIILGIFIGYHIGDSIYSRTEENLTSNMAVTPSNKVVNNYDVFSDLPNESIGSVYINYCSMQQNIEE